LKVTKILLSISKIFVLYCFFTPMLHFFLFLTFLLFLLFIHNISHNLRCHFHIFYKYLKICQRKMHLFCAFQVKFKKLSLPNKHISKTLLHLLSAIKFWYFPKQYFVNNNQYWPQIWAKCWFAKKPNVRICINIVN
jgi:hypothetical protein